MREVLLLVPLKVEDEEAPAERGRCTTIGESGEEKKAVMMRSNAITIAGRAVPGGDQTKRSKHAAKVGSVVLVSPAAASVSVIGCCGVARGT